MNKRNKDNQHCCHYTQALCLPGFASADNNKSTDDDADEGDAHADGDPRHRVLVQVVEAVRKGCEA